MSGKEERIIPKWCTVSRSVVKEVLKCLEVHNLPAEVQPSRTELTHFQGRESVELISQVTLLKSSPKGKGFLIIISSVSKLIHLL